MYISNADGPNASIINGKYYLTGKSMHGAPVWRKEYVPAVKEMIVVSETVKEKKR